MTEKAVKKAARNVLKLIERVGAFDNPGIREEKAIVNPEHNALIRRMGAEGTVLLKNETGILPLVRDKIRKSLSLDLMLPKHALWEEEVRKLMHITVFPLLKGYRIFWKKIALSMNRDATIIAW